MLKFVNLCGYYKLCKNFSVRLTIMPLSQAALQWYLEARALYNQLDQKSVGLKLPQYTKQLIEQSPDMPASNLMNIYHQAIVSDDIDFAESYQEIN